MSQNPRLNITAVQPSCSSHSLWTKRGIDEVEMRLASPVISDPTRPYGSDASRTKIALIDFRKKPGFTKTCDIYRQDEVFQEKNTNISVVRGVNESKKVANTSCENEEYDVYGQKDEFVGENMHTSAIGKAYESKKVANTSCENEEYDVYGQKDEFVEENMHTSVIGKANESKTESRSSYTDGAFEVYWKNGSFVEVSVEDRPVGNAKERR